MIGLSLLLVDPSQGFLQSPPLTSRISSTRSTSSNLFATNGRPSHEENLELLTHVVAARKIRQDRDEFSNLNDHDDAIICQGLEARQRLVTNNLGLVHFCVTDIVGKKQKLKSLSRDDLVQEGSIGLAKAVDRWDPEIGGRFSTFAVYWIRAAILRGIAQRDEIVRVPEHVSTDVRKVDRAERETVTNLAEQTGLSPKQLKRVQAVRQWRQKGTLSYESWMDTGKELTEARDDYEEESVARRAALQETLQKFLRPKEVEALSWRYGLVRDYVAEAEAAILGDGGKWGEAMSFSQVGQKMQVSAEYGRKLCHRALEKLRAAAEQGALEPNFLAL